MKIKTIKMSTIKRRISTALKSRNEIAAHQDKAFAIVLNTESARVLYTSSARGIKTYEFDDDVDWYVCLRPMWKTLDFSFKREVEDYAEAAFYALTAAGWEVTQ